MDSGALACAMSAFLSTTDGGPGDPRRSSSMSVRGGRVGRAADLPSAELGRMVDGPPREGAGRSASEALNMIGGVV